MTAAESTDWDVSRDLLVPWLYSEPDRSAGRGVGEFDRATEAFGGVGGRGSAVGTEGGMEVFAACGVYIVKHD
jgi:hypothetical protein